MGSRKELERLEIDIQNIGWSVGNYCNGNCNHCYSRQVRVEDRDLSKEDIDTVLGQLKELDIKTLNLGGNEPIFTNGRNIKKTTLPHLIESCDGEGIKVGITTNGTTLLYLHRKHPDAFSLVNDWDVSLDSPLKKEHNENRGIEIYDTVLNALDICTREGVPKAIVTCLMDWNSDEYHLKGFLDIAKEHESEFRVNTLKPVAPWHIPMMPTTEQFFGAFKYLVDRTSQVVLAEPIIAALCGVEAKGCPCGTYSFRINSMTPSGEVPISPCVYLHNYRVGNLLTDDVNEIIQSPRFKQLNQRNNEPPKFCVDIDCDYLENCRGGCSSRAYVMTGDMKNPDPYCVIMAEINGIEIPEFPKVKVGHEGIRVHENYLCTWIGEPI